MKAAQSMLVNCEPWSEWISTRCFGLRRHTATAGQDEPKRQSLIVAAGVDFARKAAA
jgi:hypothetical protein